MIKQIAFTMYPVKDLARARGFYEEDLGLTMTESFQDAWYEYDLPGGCFAITTLAEGVTLSVNAGGSIGFEVEDVDEMIEKLRAKGIQVKVEPFSTPVYCLAVVVDPEGNAITFHKVTRLLNSSEVKLGSSSCTAETDRSSSLSWNSTPTGCSP